MDMHRKYALSICHFSLRLKVLSLNAYPPNLKKLQTLKVLSKICIKLLVMYILYIYIVFFFSKFCNFSKKKGGYKCKKKEFFL